MSSESIESGTASPSRWGPFAHAPFAVIWLGTTLSLTGIAMSDTAGGWLMTTLDANPRAVSLVQVATNLPMFLFTLPAGALADLIAPRRFLIALESLITLLIAGFATLVALHLETANMLLATTFLLSALWALAAPGWLAITPMLVPRGELDSATAANSVSYNLSRAVGPAVAGLAIATLGVAAPYWAFAAANLAGVLALLWWRAPEAGEQGLPAERWTSAVRAGLRYALYNVPLRATLARTVAVYPFASAYLALLPLEARAQMTQGPEFYGVLLAAVSVGAVLGSFALTRVKAWLGPDGAVSAGTLALAAALVLFGLARNPSMALAAALLAGAAWTVVLACLYVSAQLALPDWVRGRGLAVFLTVIFGSVTAGSFVWGHIAAAYGLPIAHFVAAAGAVVAIPLASRWRLQTAAGLNLSPSMHWRTPMIVKRPADENGPVLVTVRYRLAVADPAPFLAALEKVGRQRRRDGAFAWGIFEDIAEEGLYLETFLVESWLEARHFRERVTVADREAEEFIERMLQRPREVTLLIASDLHRRSSNKSLVAAN